MDTSYTNHLEGDLWDFAYSIDKTHESDEHYEIIDFLNASSSFRSFGNGLLNVIQKKYPEISVNDSNVIQFIKQKCTDNGVPMCDIASMNTLTNWFEKGMRPKKAESSRKSMFAFAFALELNIEEIKDLFHKVYLDRAFNYRNIDEIVYYYCLQHKKSWTDAEQLITYAVTAPSNESDNTRYTAVIKGEIEQIADDDELLEYISKHGNDFERDSQTAKKEFNRLIEEAKTTAIKEIEMFDYKEVVRNKRHSSDNISVNLLYQIIVGFNVSGEKGTETIFSSSHLPKEIKSRFPEATSLGKKNIGSEELRKVIILLFSYVYWFNIQCSDEDLNYNDYEDQLNDLLLNCGFSNMYYGNPYDWLFMYCTVLGSNPENRMLPLDTFREIIEEALETE